MIGEGRAPTGAITRSLAELTIGHVQRQIGLHESKKSGPNALREGWQQFQMPISGHAGNVVAWTTAHLRFSYAFHDATCQRDVPFNYPTMVSGYELETSEPIVVAACVMGWDRQPNAAITGATVAVGCYDPTTAGVTNFSGYLHLMFEGYGALDEVDPEDMQ